MDPEAEKNGLSRHTSTSSGSCQASPRTVAAAPRATSEKASAPESESVTKTGWTASIESAATPAKSIAGTAAWQASKAVERERAIAGATR